MEWLALVIAANYESLAAPISFENIEIYQQLSTLYSSSLDYYLPRNYVVKHKQSYILSRSHYHWHLIKIEELKEGLMKYQTLIVP